MYLRWLLRAKRWAHKPPSARQVKFVLAIIAACILIVIYERIFGTPDWMEIERVRRPRINNF